MKWITRLFCKHEKQRWIRNIHGDEINLCGGKRSVWRCEKCGNILWHDKLYTPEDGAQ